MKQNKTSQKQPKQSESGAVGGRIAKPPFHLSRGEAVRLQLSDRGVETVNLALNHAREQSDPADPWVAKIVAQMRHHYNKVEGPASWTEADAVAFFARDLFLDSAPMELGRLIDQCRDWLGSATYVDEPSNA